MRFIENVRQVPADPIVLRQNWLRAYDFTTDRGSVPLNDFARENDPFARVGEVQVTAEISSVIRASDNSFRVAWTERRYVNGQLSGTERWTGILSVVVQPPRDADRLRKNPLGVFVHAINWFKGVHPMAACVWAFWRLAPTVIAAASLSACATFKPPEISYDDPIQATLVAEPPRPIRIVETPEPLPLLGQLMRVDADDRPAEAAEPTERVTNANAAARIEPVRDGFINAVQLYPYSSGALYQVYTSPGKVTDIALQAGEILVGSGPIAAGDTARWIIGDTESGSGDGRRSS